MSVIDPMMESKHHLPECTLPKGHGDCICGELRAAEQRAIAAMREPGRVRVLVEEAEQRGFHRGYRTAVDYWRTVSTRYGKRKYREGREDAARDVAARVSNWLESDEGKEYEHQYRLMYEHRLADNTADCCQHGCPCYSTPGYYQHLYHLVAKDLAAQN